MKNIISTTFFLLLTYFSLAQVGPGGVSSNLVYWLRADRDVNFPGGNGNATVWSDQSGNGNNAEDNQGGVEPTFRLSNSLLNNASSINFSANNAELEIPNDASINDGDQTAATINVVFSTPSEVINGDQVIYEQGGGTAGMIFYLNGNGTTMDLYMGVYINGDTDADYTFTSIPVNANTGYIATLTFSAGPLVGYLNNSSLGFSSIVDNSGGDPTSPLLSHTGNINIGNNGDAINQGAGVVIAQDSDFSGDIAELIYFNREINELERNLVTTYLSSKYDIATTNDLYTVGDQTANGDFDLGLVAVGNDGSNSLTSSDNSDGFILTESTALTSGQYIIAAHDDRGAVGVASDVPGGVELRLDRSWYVDVTGATNGILTFDVGELASNNAPTVTDYVLLSRAANTGDFTNTGLTPSLVNTDQIQFTVTSLNDGYYTLGTTDASNSVLDVFSVANGNWNAGATWNTGTVPPDASSARISANTTVTITNDDVIGNLVIEENATLNIQDGDPLSIDGNLTLNGKGTFTTSGNQQDDDNALFIFAADVTIAPSADLTIQNLDASNNKSVGINDNVTVTNQGSISISPDLIGLSATSSWINDENSSLSVLGGLLVTGQLTASATGNTVSYLSENAEAIKEPEGATNPYYNLVVGGTDIKNLASDIQVNDITINSILVSNDFNISVEGDWANNGAYTEGLGSVSFIDGPDNNHLISGTVNEVLYDLTVSTNNAITLSNSITIGNNLTIADGATITTGSQVVTIGTDATTIGSYTPSSTGRVVGNIRRWVNATGTSYLFPVGSAAEYRPASISFDNLNNGTVEISFVEEFPGTISSTIDDNGYNLNNTYSEGYWSVQEANGLSTTSYSVFLTANGFTSFPIDADTRIVSRELNGSTWSTSGAHSTVSFSSPTVQRTNVPLIAREFALAVQDDCLQTSTSAIAGSTDVCDDTPTQTYSVTGEATSTYNWEVVGGTITAITNAPGAETASGAGTNGDPSVVANIPGVATSEIQVTWSTPGVGYVKVTEDNSALGGSPGGCGLGAPQQVSVQYN
ncbi:MAG: hypothetical protein HRT61_11400, partial [Ekhidna sp.]|nr:hypothetical protein [Ekhidna sp.]